MPVDPNSHVPIYEQIVDHVRGLVAAGVHRPDEPLPSIRVLALELVVNPNTVQRAYQELERQGLVYMRKGRGVFVARNGVRAAQSRSEATVYARFVQGVDVARAASLGRDRLDALYERAAGGVDRTTAEPVDPAEPDVTGPDTPSESRDEP